MMRGVPTTILVICLALGAVKNIKGQDGSPQVAAAAAEGVSVIIVDGSGVKHQLYATSPQAAYDEVAPPKENCVNLIAHGWVNSANGPNTIMVTNAMMVNSDCLTATAEYYSLVRSPWYPDCAKNIVPISVQLRTIIDRLLASLKCSPTNVKCVGHSLGAHVCGATSAYNKPNAGDHFDTCWGLDPATYFAGQTWTMSAKDCKNVIAMHTSEVAGTTSSCGCSDSYMNGAKMQPECTGTACAHDKAWSYFNDIVWGNNTSSRRYRCTSADKARNTKDTGSCTQVPNLSLATTCAGQTGNTDYMVLTA